MCSACLRINGFWQLASLGASTNCIDKPGIQIHTAKVQQNLCEMKQAKKKLTENKREEVNGKGRQKPNDMSVNS